ncbi:triacylglycerol lipase 3 [Coprinopsis cinerea okayama7|uniref:Carboxylic ester hydrolase n=1 Tax=Coprinopsis cinerea (strain Okayama-7 / 130 / ATCC MYA-4618 / FGSC 9003) TaxID=240176 RepID=A8NCQ7_COPC7|nr:triacylglycerol lipase 3 [Coprinopsis cinerea okayama7\|eukprot:XP_001832601.1 triacylglycerol lipase 3 [Coprinopsis cinerea okayama7\
MLLKSFVTLSVLFSYVLGAPEVKIGDTTVVGRDLTESKVEFFGGIPFAKPPVGKLRFRSPVLKTRLDTDTFNATEYGKSCLQPPMFGPATGISEDCLTINIYRPAGTQPEEKLPILLWVYGGAFIIGGANTYDGSGLVSRGVARGTPIIYANFNYRLGPFGYPQGQEAHGERELNLGLKDVIAALEWLHANADAFGGDASKITIFGESAGAMNIGTLLLNQDFEKLVRGAILESGSASSVSAVPAAERDSVWESFVGSVPSCVSVATSGKTFPCLQDATEDEILTSYLEFVGTNFMAGLSWVPTLDLGPGSLFPGVPSELYREGKFARIPFIAGTNLDEGTLFAIGFRSPNATEAELRASTLATVSPSVDPGRAARIVDRILELYPDVPALGSPYGTGDELFGFPSIYKRASALQGDLVFDAPRRQWSEAAAEHGLKAYGYLFTQPQPGDPAAGVPHAAEISWVYGTPPDPSPSAQKFSEVMMDYWISFTVNLDPNDDNGSERPIWPQYTDQDPILLQLEGGNTTAILDDYRKEPIGFINANAPVFRK